MAPQRNDPSPITRVYLVDDEPLIRRGLRMLFTLQPGLEICGEAGGEHEALAEILPLRPDLAVVDLTLQEGDGITLIKQLHQLCPALKILVFSMHDQAQVAATAFSAGAHGYVAKEEGAERVLEAIRVVMRGEHYLSPQIADKAPGLMPRRGSRRRIHRS
jgi:DNA-binding NarL/FixJ family response regulator